MRAAARAMHSLTGVPTGTLRIVGCATSPVTVRNFLVNGFPLKGIPDPVDGCHIADHAADGKRDRSRRNDPSCHFIDDRLLVPGREKALKLMKFYRGAKLFNGTLQRLDLPCICRF